MIVVRPGIESWMLGEGVPMFKFSLVRLYKLM